MRAGFARLALPAAAALAVAACAHSEPFGTDPPVALGPTDTVLPRRLTYNLGDDRAPNGADGDSVVVFARRDPSSPAPGECLAVLPAAGGTLSALRCPPPPTPADTFVSSWLEPALSPDGTRVAFVWRRSARVSALAAWSYDLVVASVDAPAAPLASVSLARLLPGDRLVNTATETAWVTPDVVRFLAAYDSVVKVKGGGAGRLTDTMLVARALMDFVVSTGELRAIPGGDGVVAWRPLGEALSYIVPDSNPRALLYLDAAGTRTAAHIWPLPVTDLATWGSTVAAATGLDSLYWKDFESGEGRVLLRGNARRVSSARTGIIVELERRGGDQFGAPANLWLLSVPAVFRPLGG